MLRAIVNGNDAESLSVLDRGLQYGDGVFETIAVISGSMLLWDDHIRRLRAGCERLAIPPPDPETLAKEADRLCRNATRAVLKVIVTRGPSERGYGPPLQPMTTRALYRYDWPAYSGDLANKGTTVRWCATPLARNPLLAGIKHLNRLEQVLARAECAAPIIEGIMCDTHGFAIEGTMTNLFIFKDGILMTPDLSQSGVAGVVRSNVIARALELDIECRECWLKPADVESADEIFLTNSIIGLWPVSTLGARTYAIGKITQTIRRALADSNAIPLPY